MNKAALILGATLVTGVTLVFATTGNAMTTVTTYKVNETKVDELAKAIAFAEGYHDASGNVISENIPAKFNNPGDLGPGDAPGYDAEFHAGSNVVRFPDDATGWLYLKNKLRNIFAGKSKVYFMTMTFAQMAQKYAGDSANWAKNVCAYLGVSTSTTLERWYNT